MISKVLQAVFGCRHTRYSFPITVRHHKAIRSTAANLTGTYVACLDCGKELPYDWHEMKVVASVSEWNRSVRSLPAKEAA
jgi:hypothetical protein